MARWVFSEQNSEALEGPEGVPESILQILCNRGIKGKEEVADFLDPRPRRTYDPFRMNDMAPAAEAILSAADRGAQICIYGDYDADGVTSVALLLDVFQKLTDRVCFFIPSRFKEGYGLTPDAIRGLAQAGADLIVTVDCGSSSIEEVAYARSLGVEMIVTDHHTPRPDAAPDCLFLNPKRKDSSYPFPHLSGCGVAFKLAQALQRLLEQKGDQRFTKTDLNQLLDLVAISTVADVVPLLDENRTLVKYGLEVINRRQRPGLEALLEALDLKGKTLETDQIAYQLAPSINALGRMQTADLGVRLLQGAPQDHAELDPAGGLHDGQQPGPEIRSRRETDKLCRDIIEEEDSGDLFRWSFAPEGPRRGGRDRGGTPERSPVPTGLYRHRRREGTGQGTGRSVPGLDLHGMLTRRIGLFERYGGHAGSLRFLR